MGVIPFQKPNRVVMQKATDFHGSFEFNPLERGYGVTIGNAMRRILLSSLEGYAITNIKIQGVDHEFSTLTGVVEDVVEMILNLKQVRFKANAGAEDNEKIFISIKNKEQFQAGEIGKFTNSFVVLNPELVICNIDKAIQFDIELTIGKGRGYRPAEENKQKDSAIGVIAIDSIFTPIKNVKYAVEDFRVEQSTDFENLIMEVATDGSIHPEEALKEAAKILIQHFVLFSDENIMPESKAAKQVQEVDETFLQMRKILKTPLADLDLSVRAYNCLKAAEIRTLGELVSYHIDDLLKFRNFGKKSLSELEEFVIEKGLSFGIDIAKYNLNDD
jgi:DNA-directed RNA polymerase subunit alpha